MKLSAAVAFLMLNAWIYYFLAPRDVIPARRSFVDFPLVLEDWTCPGRQRLDAAIEERLGVTDYLVCTFAHGVTRAWVGVYVGYHERQWRDGSRSAARSAIHPPRHCLPGSGWNVMQAELVHLVLPGLPEGGALVNRLLIAKGSQRQLVYYWYQSRGRILAEDWRKVVSLFWDRITRDRTDGSLVRFTVPLQDAGVEAAEASFQDLAARLLPRLPDYVPG